MRPEHLQLPATEDDYESAYKKSQATDPVFSSCWLVCLVMASLVFRVWGWDFRKQHGTWSTFDIAVDEPLHRGTQAVNSLTSSPNNCVLGIQMPAAIS